MRPLVNVIGFTVGLPFDRLPQWSELRRRPLSEQLMDSSIPTHFVAHSVRERQAFTWEGAIHMLTGRPAREWSLGGRDLVAEGCVADLVVIDPESVGPRLPPVA